MQNIIRLINKILIFLINLQKKFKNKKTIKSIIMINWHGKIGDAIVSSFFIKALLKNGYNVTIISTNNLKTLYVKDYSVSKFIEINSVCFSNIIKCTSLKTDAIIPLFGILQTFDLMFLMLFPKAAIFTSDTRLKNDLLVNNMPIKQIYLKILDYLKIYHFEKDLIIPINKDFKNFFYILFNPFGSRDDKSISAKKSAEILKEISKKYIDKNILLLESSQTNEIANIILNKAKKPPNVFIKNIKSYYEMFNFVYFASYIITVDTSVAHVASAFRKNCIVIYRDFEGFNPWTIEKESNTKFIFSKVESSKKSKIESFNTSDIIFNLEALSKND